MNVDDESPRSKSQAVIRVLAFLKFPWNKLWSGFFTTRQNNSLHCDEGDQPSLNRCPRKEPHAQPIVPYEGLSSEADDSGVDIVDDGFDVLDVSLEDRETNQDDTVGFILEDVYSAETRSLELRMESMEQQLKSLNDLIERRMRDDSIREETITSLHTELQGYKQGLLDKTLEPSIQGMIQVYDHLTTMIDSVTDDSDSVEPDLINSIRVEIQDLLSLLGVTSFSEPGQHFVPGRQRIARTTDTSDEKLVGSIKEHLRVGFESNRAVLRPESVEVYARSAETDQGA